MTACPVARAILVVASFVAPEPAQDAVPPAPDWVQLTTAAGWSPRAYHQPVVLGEHIYVLGGGNYVPRYEAHADVWRSADGVHWEEVMADAPWHPRLWFSNAVWKERHEHSAYVFDDRIVVAGGHAQPLSAEVSSLFIPPD